MVQDFVNCYRHAQRWADLYEEYPEQKSRDLTLYIKAIHNVLNALFMAQRRDKFEMAYALVNKIEIEYENQLTRDQLSTLQLIKYLHGINRYFLTAEFDEGVIYVKQIEVYLKENTFDWDLNRILLFNYKIASIYFCQGDLNSAIDHLNIITNEVYPNFREDIQCFARILNLIAHFDLGNEALVSHQVKSTYRFLLKMEHLHRALKEIFDFIKMTPKIQEKEIKREFLRLKNRLQELNQEPYERRPFLYLDIISWLESKVEDVPVGKIIARKMKNQ
jgi:tetratricopeptide (TPR) repeat protein